MGIIKRIKLPNQETHDIGALSSNITYDGVQGQTSTLNAKLQTIPSVSASTSMASGTPIGTITINGVTTTFYIPIYDGTVV